MVRLPFSGGSVVAKLVLQRAKLVTERVRHVSKMRSKIGWLLARYGNVSCMVPKAASRHEKIKLLGEPELLHGKAVDFLDHATEKRGDLG